MRMPLAALLFAALSLHAHAQTAPSFPIIPPPDSTIAAHANAGRARRGAASLAMEWLYDRSHPAKDSIDFPPGLIASLQSALMRLEATTTIPELDSARHWLKITPREWDGETGAMTIDLKRSRWAQALCDGKKKTGNREIDALIKRYGLRVASQAPSNEGRVMITCTADSLVNVRPLTLKLMTLKGVKPVETMAMMPYASKTVHLTDREDRWRFIYEYTGDKGTFRWAFEVLTDGSVVHVRLRR